MKRSRVACVGLLALACGDSAADYSELKQQWLETAPRQYVAKSCSTGFAAPVCTVSAVEGGEAVATRTQWGNEGWRDVAPASDALEELWSAASGKVEKGCERRVTQHDTQALPARVYFDCGEEGWGIELACFAEDTLDLSRCQ